MLGYATALEEAQRSSQSDGAEARRPRRGSVEESHNGYLILFAVLKIVVVLLFVINTAAILTWGERRQCAMIQDRIGPNRAVIFLPGIVFKVLPLVVGLGLAAR